MSGGVVAGCGSVFVQYHQVLVQDAGTESLPDLAEAVPSGLLAAIAQGGARILSGIHTGRVSYSWSVGPTAEPPLGTGTQPEVGEAEILTSSGVLQVRSVMTSGDECPPVVLGAPGRYRLYLSYWDRFREWDGAADTAVERFHMSFSPADVL